MNGTNIAIVGKSGIGKSTLLNYLFGKEVAKTGTGEPVTKQGFHFFSDIIDGKKLIFMIHGESNLVKLMFGCTI